VLLFGYDRADGIAALFISALMLRSGWGLLRESGRVLLEAAPTGMDPQAIGEAMARERGVVEVHDLHVWEVTSGFPALAAHVIVKPGDDCHAMRRRLQQMLSQEFAIDHVTLQVDHATEVGRLLEIEQRPS
jgi:cobalt-zinc-cadmium efflux system protein